MKEEVFSRIVDMGTVEVLARQSLQDCCGSKKMIARDVLFYLLLHDGQVMRFSVPSDVELCVKNALQALEELLKSAQGSKELDAVCFRTCTNVSLSQFKECKL